MTWKLRDALACLFAPVIAAFLGTAVGFMMILTVVKSSGGSFADEDLRPLGGIFGFALACLWPLGLLLRFTIHPHLPSRSRTLLLTVVSGPLLVFASSIILIITTTFLGTDWYRILRVVGRSPYQLMAWGGILLIVFVQGSTLGFLAGRWFTPVQPHGSAASLGRKWIPGIAGVILVLSASIIPAVIFWKRGSDRSGCIMNCRNVQQAMRSYSGIHGYSADQYVSGLGAASLVGPGKFIELLPKCPAGGTYTWVEGRTPRVGELMILCSHPGHVPPNHGDW